MFIDDESLDKLTTWIFDSGMAQERDLELLNELVTRIRDDTWRGRWWREEHDLATDIHAVLPRPGLRVRLFEEPIAPDQWGVVIVDIGPVPDDYGEDPWALE